MSLIVVAKITILDEETSPISIRFMKKVVSEV